MTWHIEGHVCNFKFATDVVEGPHQHHLDSVGSEV